MEDSRKDSHDGETGVGYAAYQERGHIGASVPREHALDGDNGVDHFTKLVSSKILDKANAARIRTVYGVRQGIEKFANVSGEYVVLQCQPLGRPPANLVFMDSSHLLTKAVREM